MMNTLAIRGAAADLMWSYVLAASLRDWSVAGTPGAWTFTATIASKNDFRLSQRPLEVVTPNGWRWPVQTLSVNDKQLVASIGFEKN